MDEKRYISSILHTDIGNDKRQNLFSSPPPSFYALHERQRTNSHEDLFTVTTKSKGDIGSVTDLPDSAPTPVGRPRRGWSKRSKLLIALAVFVIVIVALCAYLAVATKGKNGSGDSKADDEAAIQPDTDTTTDKEEPIKISTLSTKPTTKPESTPAPSGEWTSWDSWTTCSATCGSGVQERNRTCNKVDPTDTDCEGDNLQQAFCTLNACPQAEWAPWDSWTACSVTCGAGVQERNRTCNKVDPADADCEGENRQQASCTVAACHQMEWTSWGSWTTCTAMCGSGVHTRYRTCNNTKDTDTECEGGQYVQQAVCTLDDCSVYGKWTTWSQWGNCGSTCGGGVRSRSRQCYKASSSDLDCVGDTEQQTTCNEWDCPDCGKTCSVEQTLNAACDTCVCESSNIQGRVLSTAGNPVSFADIAAETAPSTVLAQSNSTGFFSIGDTCVTSTIIVTREGFQDEVVQITATYQMIYLEFEVLPRITEHPQSKYRITGEDVLLCCTAVGAPSITYYEWFYNSVLLDKNLYTDNGTGLEMKNVQPSDSGEYTCRANSEGRGIYSNKATLIVRDNDDDFCEDALQQKQMNLPEACAQPGQNTTLYEVGDCASKPCRQANTNANEQCSDSSKSCCTPSQFERRTVNCTGYDIELFVIKACTCGACDTTTTVQVSGKVISAKSGSAVQYAEVWLNGGLETHTSYTGTFYIAVDDSINKVVFTIKDTYNNTFLDTTKVVEIANGMGGTISVIIQMLEMSDPVTINSTTDAVLSLGETKNPVALLKVPANSFYRSDGIAYTGLVSSFVTFIDPTDDTIQDAIPGVFQFIDEEGSNTDLESKGIFNLQFKDDAGDDLYVDGIIEVSFPDQAAGNFTLWKMNTVSGLWEHLTPSVLADRRKRRQANYRIGGIDMSRVSSRSYVNVDAVFKILPPEYRCYFKARVYKDESLSEQLINDNAAYSIEFRRTKSKAYVSYYGPTVSLWGLMGFCLGLPCGYTNSIGYISLNSHFNYYGALKHKLKAAQPNIPNNFQAYKLIDNSTTIGVSLTGSFSGPLYKSASTCTASDITQSHFPFYKASTPDIYTARYFSLGGVNRTLSDIVWYPERDSLHTMCLIKVKISFQIRFGSPDTALKFHVLSFGGTLPAVKDIPFGIREYDVHISEKGDYICAEYKCSGKLEGTDSEDQTRVQIALASWSSYRCRIQDISEEIATYSLNGHLNGLQFSNNPFEAYIPDSYGKSIGVYEAHTSTTIKDFETTHKRVENECLKMHENENEGAAVHLYCY